MTCSLLVFLPIAFTAGFESVEHHIILRRKILGPEFSNFCLENKKTASMIEFSDMFQGIVKSEQFNSTFPRCISLEPYLDIFRINVTCLRVT